MMSRFTKSCIISSKKKEHVKVYYKQIFKLVNCLQIKATDKYLTIIFKVGLHPYVLLLIVDMKWETLIEHKEAMVVIYEEIGPKGYNYFFIISHNQNGVCMNITDSNHSNQ